MPEMFKQKCHLSCKPGHTEKHLSTKKRQRFYTSTQKLSLCTTSLKEWESTLKYKYNGDLNNRIVQYTYHGDLSDHQMGQFLYAIWMGAGITIWYLNAIRVVWMYKFWSNILQGKGSALGSQKGEGVCYYRPHFLYKKCRLTNFHSPPLHWAVTTALSPKPGT